MNIGIFAIPIIVSILFLAVVLRGLSNEIKMKRRGIKNSSEYLRRKQMKTPCEVNPSETCNPIFCPIYHPCTIVQTDDHSACYCPVYYACVRMSNLAAGQPNGTKYPTKKRPCEAPR